MDVRPALRLLLGGATLCCCVSLPAQAAPREHAAALQGTVTQVLDGESLVFTPTGQAPITVRLRDIDAPLPCQDHGAEARKALAELALQRPATLQPRGRDGQGRTLGAVQVAGVDLATHQVEEGHAWSQRVKWDNGPLVKQERMARALTRGLHAGGTAIKPADFRRSHGPCL